MRSDFWSLLARSVVQVHEDAQRMDTIVMIVVFMLMSVLFFDDAKVVQICYTAKD